MQLLTFTPASRTKGHPLKWCTLLFNGNTATIFPTVVSLSVAVAGMRLAPFLGYESLGDRELFIYLLLIYKVNCFVNQLVEEWYINIFNNTNFASFVQVIQSSFSSCKISVTVPNVDFIFCFFALNMHSISPVVLSHLWCQFQRLARLGVGCKPV